MVTKQELINEVDALRKRLEHVDVKGERADDLMTEIRRLRDRIETLSPAEEGAELDLMDLEGFGEEFWKSIDVEEYIRKERASWR